MAWLDALIAISTATVVTACVIYGLGWSGVTGVRGARAPSTVLLFFSVTFAASWAAGIWLPAFGPRLLGRPWVPYVVGAIAVAAVALIAKPPTTRRSRVIEIKPAPPEGELLETLGTGFAILSWVTVVALAVLIGLGYLP